MKKRILINPRKKQKILERDNFTCLGCGCKGDFNALEIDHINDDPTDNDYDNLQTLCYKCNLNKRWNKELKNNNTLYKTTPLERLEKIKSKLIEYKNLSWEEFQIIFCEDSAFRKVKSQLSSIKDLFFSLSNNIKSQQNNRSYVIDQRDACWFLLTKEFNMTQQELSERMEQLAGVFVARNTISDGVSKVVKELGDKNK